MKMIQKSLITLILISTICAGCEMYSPGKKVLLIDYSMTDPIVHSGIGKIFSDLNSSFVYRQFYPDIVNSDIKEYDIIALYGGNSPYIPGPKFNKNSFIQLKRFVKNGGILLLGATPAGTDTKGLHDKQLFNILLKEMQIDISINNDLISDLENGYASTLFFRPKYEILPPFYKEAELADLIPLDKSPSLNVGNSASIFARASNSALNSTQGFWTSHLDSIRAKSVPHAPVIAAGKYGHGTVFVFSRNLFNSISYSNTESAKPLADTSILSQTETFLRSFTQFIISVSDEKTEISSSNIEFHFPPDSIAQISIPFYENDVLDRLPEGVIQTPITSTAPLYNSLNRRLEQQFIDGIDDSYSWIIEDGIKAGWTFTATDTNYFKNLARMTDFTDINLLWGVSRPQRLFTSLKENSKEIIEGWKVLDGYLNGSKTKWFMGMNLSDLRDKSRYFGGLEGQLMEFPDIFGSNFWEKEMFEPTKLIADLSVETNNLAGIIFDLEMYHFPFGMKNIFQEFGFDNSSYSNFLKTTNGKIDIETWSKLTQIKREKRIEALMKYGLLDKYYSVLETSIEIQARDIKSRLLKINPKLIFGFHQTKSPSTWFY